MISLFSLIFLSIQLRQTLIPTRPQIFILEIWQFKSLFLLSFINCFIRCKKSQKINLNHVFEESVDLVFSVAGVSALDVVDHLLAPSALRVIQLEVPQEIAGVLEVGTDGVDLVDQVLHTDDSPFA